MRPLDLQTASVVAGLHAAQQCCETYLDLYSWPPDDGTMCIELLGHELCGIDHHSADGTTW